MKHLKNRWLTLRHKKPGVAVVLIGLPQFCFTLEHNHHQGYWETAICIFIFGIFINWGESI